MTESRTVDVAVIGGGPAGATIARRLSQMGWRVGVLERRTFPRPHVGESLPPSILPLLDYLQIRQRVEGAGFIRCNDAVIHWAGELRSQPTATVEPGFQVDRGQFDQLLLQSAVETGALIFQPATAEKPVRRLPGKWLIPVQSPSHRFTISARFIVDASGRALWHRCRRQRTAPRTLALYAYWSKPSDWSDETRVEAGMGHWYWGAPLPDGTVNATVFVDPQFLTNQGHDFTAIYRELLQKSNLLSHCARQSLASEIQACDATSLIADESVGPDWIRIGDANFTIDPLSSQGVQTAIASAIRGAVVVNTLLAGATAPEITLSFYREFSEQSSQAHQRLTAQFCTEHAQVSPTTFWTSRSSPTQLSSESRVENQARPLREEDRLCLSPPGRWSRAGVIEGDFVVEKTVFIHPALDRSLAFIHNVPIAALFRYLDQPISVRKLENAWARLLPPSIVRSTLRWLWEANILTTQGEESSVSTSNQ